jgi:16S rRNA (guanine527-N7)-methyltransferase
VFSALVEARELGFLGPGPIEDQLRHSLTFTRLVDSPPAVAVDLGSGGGLPGLVLARCWPSSTWVLLDGNRRRTDFLSSTVIALGMGDRVSVRCERAEESGRVAALRGAADLVTARSFGPPAVVAECAAPLLAVDGVLIVSEPPGGNPDRWPAAPLASLGLVPDGVLTSPAAFQRLRLATTCPDRYPRRVGIPSKRPLF